MKVFKRYVPSLTGLMSGRKILRAVKEMAPRGLVENQRSWVAVRQLRRRARRNLSLIIDN